MQAIQTKFMGPTNTRGSRIKAVGAKGQEITVPFDYGQGVDGAHDAAARALIVKLGWYGVWARGGSPDGKGNVYVCVERDSHGYFMPYEVIKQDCIVVMS